MGYGNGESKGRQLLLPQLAFLTADIFASVGVLPLSCLRAYTPQDAIFYTCSYLYIGNFTISTVKSPYSHCFNFFYSFTRTDSTPKMEVLAFVRKANWKTYRYMLGWRAYIFKTYLFLIFKSKYF